MDRACAALVVAHGTKNSIILRSIVLKRQPCTLLALFMEYTRNNVENEDLQFVYARLACLLSVLQLCACADCRGKTGTAERGLHLFYGQYKHLIAAVYLFYSLIYNVMYININVQLVSS